MTDSEKLDFIISEMTTFKQDIADMKQDMADMKQRITSLELHLENGTDKGLQLLAENHVELVKKLNQAIPVADNHLMYEIKVNYLTERVDKLEKELTDIKDKIA